MQQIVHLSPDADRIVISVNPKAGPRSCQLQVQRLAELLGEHYQVDLLTDLDEVSRRANAYHAEGRLRALVGVGGDGTAAELVNRTVPGLPLAMFPYGNENLLARHFHLPHTPEECCRMIAQGAMRRVDAGQAAGRVFLLMFSCGFDADVVHRLHQQREGHVGNWSYVKPMVESLRSYQYPELQVSWDEEGPDTEAAGPSNRVCWLFAFNLPCYGGGLRIAPHADGSDGWLDVCTFRRGDFWHALKYAGAVLVGQHQNLTDYSARRVRRLRVASDASVPYQLDGDPGGFLPVEIETLPGRLSLVVPKEDEG